MKWFFKSHKSQFIFGALLTENDTRISDKEGSQTDVGIVKLLANLTKNSEFYCRELQHQITSSSMRKNF